MSTRDPNVPYGFGSVDVTTDVQAWVNGGLDNNGWADAALSQREGWLGHLVVRVGCSSRATDAACLFQCRTRSGDRAGLGARGF